MKLARSTTFRPEKILSFAMDLSFESLWASPVSAPMELGRALFEEGGRAFSLVVGCGAEAEVRGFEQQAFALARIHPFVCRLERELDGDRRVGGDLRQDRLGARDQVGRGNDLVDEADAMGLLRADHVSGEDQLQGASFADEPRQTLGPAAAWNQPERDFGLAELRSLHREPQGAGHRGLAAAPKREAVNRRDHRLS